MLRDVPNKLRNVKDCQQTIRNEERGLDQILPHSPQRTTLPMLWSWAVSIQDPETIRVSWQSHLVCGTLLEQLSSTSKSSDCFLFGKKTYNVVSVCHFLGYRVLPIHCYTLTSEWFFEVFRLDILILIPHIMKLSLWQLKGTVNVTELIKSAGRTLN